MHQRSAVFFVCLGLAMTLAVPIEPTESESSNNVITGKQPELVLLDKLNDGCNRREAPSCLMLKLVTYVNRLLKKADINLGGGVEISQTIETVDSQDALTTVSSRAGSEFKTDEELVGDLIASKLYSFVSSRALRMTIVPGAEVVLQGRMSGGGGGDGSESAGDARGALSFDLTLREEPKETGRGKMKNMGPLLAAGAMKIGMVGILAFKALALLVGKALLVSKLAFLLAAIIGLKKLFSGQKHVTYEVVAHPHHSHSHVETHGGGGGGHGGGGGDSYSSGWGRSIDVAPTSATHPSSTVESAHELAYKAQAPTIN